MSKAATSHVRRDAPSAFAATRFSEAYEYFRLIGRDAHSFFQLLVRTLSTLPGDVVAASIVINLLGLALPLGILQVYDRIIPNASTATLAMLSIGIGVALVVETILRIVRSRVLAWSAMKLAWKANVDAACRVATAPAELVDAQPAARWFQRLQAVVDDLRFRHEPRAAPLIDMVFVVIFIPLLFASSGWLAAVPLIVFVFFGVAAHRTRARDARHHGRAPGGGDQGAGLPGRGPERHRHRQGAGHRAADPAPLRAAVRAVGGLHVPHRASGRRLHRASRSLVSTLTQIATATIGAILAINGQISIGVVACSTMLAGRVDPAAAARGISLERDPGRHGGRGGRKTDPRPADERRPGHSLPRCQASAGAWSCSTTSRSLYDGQDANRSSPERTWM